jgi:transcriptional regulator with XRE-family HTH domain
MEFGKKLKELRTSLNCSQKELSEKTGLSSGLFKELRITR